MNSMSKRVKRLPVTILQINLERILSSTQINFMRRRVKRLEKLKVQIGTSVAQ